MTYDDGADLLLDLIREQRQRMVASVMSAVEALGPKAIAARPPRSPVLSGDEVAALRAQIIPALDNFANLMRDLVKVDRRQAIRNEEAVRVLAAVHSQLARIEPILDDLELDE